MKLHYSKQDGASKEFDIGERSITIGRSPDADIILLDDKVSRVHCGIRLWDGEFYIKDLKSKNGTFVNGRRVEVAKLKASDVIKVGSYTFTFEQPAGTGTETALREISDEMDLGKGYSTLLKEIVNDSQDSAPAPAVPATPAPAPAVKPGLRKLPQRPPIRLNIKRVE
jgi:pSer/pThr/pTyr-binding forkhead associated (FHA) protein